jgi:hypothetical protein
VSIIRIDTNENHANAAPIHSSPRRRRVDALVVPTASPAPTRTTAIATEASGRPGDPRVLASHEDRGGGQRDGAADAAGRLEDERPRGEIGPRKTRAALRSPSDPSSGSMMMTVRGRGVINDRRVRRRRQ